MKKIEFFILQAILLFLCSPVNKLSGFIINRLLVLSGDQSLLDGKKLVENLDEQLKDFKS